jgi:hypothetical protein
MTLEGMKKLIFLEGHSFIKAFQSSHRNDFEIFVHLIFRSKSFVIGQFRNVNLHIRQCN